MRPAFLPNALLAPAPLANGPGGRCLDLIATRPPVSLAPTLADHGLLVRVVNWVSPREAATIAGRPLAIVDSLPQNMSSLGACRLLRSHPKSARAYIALVVSDEEEEALLRARSCQADAYWLRSSAAETLVERIVDVANHHPDLGYERTIVDGDLVIDRIAHSVRWQGKLVALSLTEFRLLTFFHDHCDQVITPRQLCLAMGRDITAIDDRSVSQWISRLRRSLRRHGIPDRFRTIRNLGFTYLRHA